MCNLENILQKTTVKKPLSTIFNFSHINLFCVLEQFVWPLSVSYDKIESYLAYINISFSLD